MNRRRILITGVIVAMFVMMVIAPSMVQQQTNVRNDSTGTGCCGDYYCIPDLVGVEVVHAYFSASWLFSCQNGTLVHEYAPISTAHSIIPIVTWIKVCNPKWSNPTTNTYISYGNIVYHVGLWYIAFPEYYHATVTVKPNSYGRGTMSVGSGEYK